MNKRILACFLPILMFISCDIDSKKLTIPEAELASILVDLHIAEVLSIASKVPRDSIEYYKKIKFEKIAFIHGYEIEIIKSDIRKLQKMPKKIISIYQQVDKKFEEIKIVENKLETDAKGSK